MLSSLGSIPSCNDRELTTESRTSLETRHQGRGIHAIAGWIKDEARVLCGWLAAICTALVGFWLSEGTHYHQLAVGLLASAVSFFVALALFEALWRTVDNQHRGE